MNDKPSADEMPKKKVAKRVISPKRRYYFPTLGKSVEATSREEAEAAVTKEKEGGD